MSTDISTESVAVAVAEPPSFNSEDTKTWTPAQKQEWSDTGKVTAPPKKEPAESAAAPSSGKKTVTTEPKGKSAAESGAAPKQKKPEKGKATTDDRIGELTGEIKRLQAQLGTLQKQPVKAAEPAKQPEVPKRPNPFTWTGTPEDFEKAMDAYETRQFDYVRQQTVQQTQQQLREQQTAKEIESMFADVTKRYPDAKDKIVATNQKLVEAVFGTREAPTKGELAFLAAFVNESEQMGDLLYTLSDGTTLDTLIQTAKSAPGKALRVLRDMERDIEAAIKKPAIVAEEHVETKPPVKTEKPPALKTPHEVGGRGAPLEDGAVAAARSGDFLAFDREMIARARASQR